VNRCVFKAVEKSSVNSWITQMQWIPDCWSGDRKNQFPQVLWQIRGWNRQLTTPGAQVLHTQAHGSQRDILQFDAEDYDELHGGLWALFTWHSRDIICNWQRTSCSRENEDYRQQVN